MRVQSVTGCSYSYPDAESCVGWEDGVGFTPTKFSGLNVEDSFWMIMSCSASYIGNKTTTSDSIPMTFLKNGGAIYIGGVNITYGSKGCPRDTSSCNVCLDSSCSQCSADISGGDACISSLYVEILKRASAGARIGDIFKDGKNYYLQNYDCPYGTRYHYDITRLYGDPTLKIKKVW